MLDYKVYERIKKLDIFNRGQWQYGIARMDAFGKDMSRTVFHYVPT